MFRVLGLLSVLILSACASHTRDYEQRLVKSLPNQRDVSFANQKTYPGKVLCGQYTALVGNGFSTRTRPFVVTPERVMENPTNNETAVYCSKNPAAALYERTGIGPDNDDWTALSSVYADMQAINEAVVAYYNRNAALPMNLEKLPVESTSISPETLLDPWGKPYVYRGGLSGRTVPRFELHTLGVDGTAGGQGSAADIHLENLPLLGHVLNLVTR